ncbi:hypothetical protein GCM10010502_26000 [Kitasatospora aureofaciens]|uniref:Uncharacterized protein n=1 Tax=Kitasatospora aureofaciens TaxID=1894 RepID=A0A8H9HLZ3_KITAU|nr:hypothetical protein GCM10010502_26000 [Kitasatospora aureofaciens]
MASLAVPTTVMPRAGELQQHGADPAGRTVHQQGLPRPYAEDVQHPLAGLGRHRDRGGLLPAQRGGLVRQHVRVEQRVLGVTAPHQAAEHLVAGREARHLRADGLHHAGHFVAGDGGEDGREERVQLAAALLAVDRVDAHRADRDPDLAGAGGRQLDVDGAQHVRAAVPGKGDRLGHGRIPWGFRELSREVVASDAFHTAAPRPGVPPFFRAVRPGRTDGPPSGAGG